MSSIEELAKLKLPLEVIVKATNNFADENLIRQGGFGRIYKGYLFLSGIPTDIVARRLHYDYGQDDFEFWNEISMLARLKHDNLVSIIGFCDEEREKIIINTYEVNGSLDKYLSSTTLTWMQRLQICVDVASALNYIHYGYEFSVIHRNIKSSKILLDEKWKAKLSGFELSKQNTKARKHRLVLAEISGTIGYVDPTYEKTGFVSHKSDVYSFGVLLFEVLCGRRAFVPDEREPHSPQSTEKDYQGGKLEFMGKVDKIPDPHISTESAFVPYWREQHSPQSTEQDYNGAKLDVMGKQDKEGKLEEYSLLSNGREFAKKLLGDELTLSENFPSDELHSKSSRVNAKAKVLSVVREKESPPSTGRKVESTGPTSEPSFLSDYEQRSISREPSSFVGVHPTSFGGPSSITSNAGPALLGGPSSNDGPALLGGSSSNDGPLEIEPFFGITLVGKNFRKFFPNAFYREQDSVIDQPLSTFMSCASVDPLYTMKRLDQYKDTPKGEFLAKLAKSGYEGKNLDEIIDPALRKQIDPKSFHIFTETAYKCLDDRPQRPNIDQVLIKLKRALKIQEKTIASREIEGTTSNRWKGGPLERLQIPFEDIKKATNNFNQEFYLGEGGYGKVYCAELELPTEKKATDEISRKLTTVAIKRITNAQQGRKGFIAEIDMLTRCKHTNIISLLGFCDEGPNMILVYEHASNGSLDDYLTSTVSSTNLTWVQRIKIGIDIARGLDSLHERVDTILHLDIKSGNILLSKNLVAKIADFGLSRSNQQAKSAYTKHIVGTDVYLCPQYGEGGRLTTAIDIYSFGVVLFEILSGKLAYDQIYIVEDARGIAQVARLRFKDNKINEMVDPKVMEEVDELVSTLHKGPNQDSLRTYIDIAYRCVAVSQKDRPTAKHILEELEKALSYQVSQIYP
ncbi:putative protein kinase RLK-Pelle-SD-2b family [Helianthus anomalus]